MVVAYHLTQFTAHVNETLWRDCVSTASFLGKLIIFAKTMAHTRVLTPETCCIILFIVRALFS